MPREERTLYSAGDLAWQRKTLEEALALTKADPQVQERLGQVMRHFRAHELFALATHTPDQLDRAARGPGVNGPQLAYYVRCLWQRRIKGMKLLGRRFENLASTAVIRVNSGKIAADGSWDAERTQPVSEAEPAVYALEWKQPQTLRGLALKEIDGAVTEVDVFTGAPGTAVNIEAADGWENVASYQQRLRHYYQPDPLHNSAPRYLDGYVDFGREVSTRAVRLRVVKQWDTKDHYPSGVRADQGGQVLDLKRCHVYGVAALKYLGGEKTVDPLVTERLEVLDAATGKIVQEVHLPKVGSPGGATARGNVLAINSHGEIFAISDGKLVRVDLGGGKHQVLASDLITPTALACDTAGNFYVFDAAKDRKNIRVYDAGGKFTRTIGAIGGYQTGAWDPNRMEHISALAVDKRGQVWAVDRNYWPKRVSMWSNDGKFLREFLGPTHGLGCARQRPRRHRSPAPRLLVEQSHANHRRRSEITSAFLVEDPSALLAVLQSRSHAGDDAIARLRERLPCRGGHG